MKDWDDLQTILALGRAGTMKDAAHALAVSETTIARRLRKASGEDIARIFIRDGQRWRPTPLGRRLIALGEKIESQILEADLAIEDVSNGITGELTVTSLAFLSTHFIGPEVKAFQKLHPGLRVTLDASHERVSLAYREADVALRMARPAEGRLIAKRLARAPVVAFSFSQTPPKRWVGLQEALDWTPEMRLGFRHFGGPPSIRIHSYEGILPLTIDGEMGGVASSCMLRRMGATPAWMSEAVDRELWVTYHDDMRNSAKVRAFVEWISAAYPSASRCLCGNCG